MENDNHSNIDITNSNVGFEENEEFTIAKRIFLVFLFSIIISIIGYVIHSTINSGDTFESVNAMSPVLGGLYVIFYVLVAIIFSVIILLSIKLLFFKM